LKEESRSRNKEEERNGFNTIVKASSEIGEAAGAICEDTKAKTREDEEKIPNEYEDITREHSDEDNVKRSEERVNKREENGTMREENEAKEENRNKITKTKKKEKKTKETEINKKQAREMTKKGTEEENTSEYKRVKQEEYVKTERKEKECKDEKDESVKQAEENVEKAEKKVEEVEEKVKEAVSARVGIENKIENTNDEKEKKKLKGELEVAQFAESSLKNDLESARKDAENDQLLNLTVERLGEAQIAVKTCEETRANAQRRYDDLCNSMMGKKNNEEHVGSKMYADFWSSVKKIESIMEAGKMYKFEGEMVKCGSAYSEGDGSTSRGFYVRKCYSTFYDYVLESKSRSHLIITGTPGIGKSLFFYYLLHRSAVIEKRTVVLQRTQCVLKFDPNGGVQETFNEYQISKWIEDERSFYVFDERDFNISQEWRGHFVALISPEKLDRVLECTKNEECRIYMPIWDRKEYFDLSDAIGIERERAENVFEVCGRIPRHLVDTYGNVDDAEKIMTDAVSGMRDDDIDRLMNISSALPEAGKLIHIIPKDDYTNYELSFASDFAMRKMIKKKRVFSFRKSMWLIEASYYRKSASQQLFEHFVGILFGQSTIDFNLSISESERYNIS